MRLFTKLSLAFSVISLLVLIVGLIATNASQKALEQVIGEKYVLLAEVSLNEIDKDFYYRIKEFKILAQDSLLQNIAKESNQMFEQLDDMQGFIDEKEKEWLFATELNLTDTIRKLINNPASRKLQERMQFHQLISGYPMAGEIFITNKYGANVAMTKKTSDYYQADEDWWQIARKEGVYIEEVKYDESAGIYSNNICIRMDDINGEFLGVMKVVLNIDEAVERIKSLGKSLFVAANKSKETAGYFPKYQLITSTGKLVYSSQEHHILDEISDKQLLKRISHNKSGYFIHKDALTGEGKLFAHACSRGFKEERGLNWSIVVEHDTSDIFKMVIQLKKTILFISIIALCIALIIGFFIAGSVSTPIKKLQKTAALIGEGNLDVSIDIDYGQGEVGALAESFGKMIANLRKTTTSVENLNQEIAERKCIESTLRESEERYKNLFENARDLIVITDLEGRITAVNKTVERYGFRKEDLVGKNQLIFIPKEYQQQVIDDIEKIKAGVIARGEITMMSPKGNIFIEYCNNPILKGDRIIGVQSVMRDISNRRELENAQRLAQLGKFVAAMAHEVNNPLMVISGRAQLALMENIGNADVKNNLNIVMEECQRAKDIINRLLKFSKPAKGEVSNIDANKIIDETVNIVEHQFSLEGVIINRKYEDNLPLISFDPKQLQEVIMNLLTNARDAIVPEKGTIDIITSKEGDKVKIEVRDSGIGMEQEILHNILNPFWTSKSKGTGLGLSICYSIVRDHGGLLNFESTPGQGTRAMIILPSV